MVRLVHEIWETFDEHGQVLPGVCLAGPDGNGFRKLQDASAKCVRRFEADCHFEAMTIYYQHYGWGEYTTDQGWDRQPYPQEWGERQRSGL